MKPEFITLHLNTGPAVEVNPAHIRSMSPEIPGLTAISFDGTHAMMVRESIDHILGLIRMAYED